MATRKQKRQKSLLQILALLIAVVIVLVAAYLVQNWWNNRPGPEPQEVTITATVGEETREILPYMVCEPGTECPEAQVPIFAVGPDETLKIKLPRAIYDHDWQVLTIYDDPGANDQVFHGPNDTTEIEIPGSVDPVGADAGPSDPRPSLVVVEISSVLIGTDDNGDEAPFATVWAIGTQEQ